MIGSMLLHICSNDCIIEYQVYYVRIAAHPAAARLLRDIPKWPTANADGGMVRWPIGTSEPRLS